MYSTWFLLTWNENSGSHPHPSFLLYSLADSITVDPGFVSYTYLYTYTHTHTVDYSVTQGEDVVLWGELEAKEVTDARSGSFTVLITITWTFTPSSHSSEALKFSLKWSPPPLFVCCPTESEKCGKRESAESSLAAWLFLTARWGCVWACTCHQACKFSN